MQQNACTHNMKHATFSAHKWADAHFSWTIKTQCLSNEGC